MNNCIECACYSPKHTIRISTDDDPDFFMISFHLNNNRSFFVRFWEALKHIWGGRNIYGNYDEVLLSKERVEELKKLCENYLEKGKN